MKYAPHKIGPPLCFGHACNHHATCLRWTQLHGADPAVKRIRSCVRDGTYPMFVRAPLPVGEVTELLELAT